MKDRKQHEQNLVPFLQCSHKKQFLRNFLPFRNQFFIFEQNILCRYAKFFFRNSSHSWIWIISCVCQSIYVEFRYLSQIINVLGSISIYTLNTSDVENIFIFKNDLLRNNKPIFSEINYRVSIVEITGWIKSNHCKNWASDETNLFFLIWCNVSKISIYSFMFSHYFIIKSDL